MGLCSAPYSVMYCVNGKPRSSLLIESTDSMILILILQWTYRDSVLSSDARLHVKPIHFQYVALENGSSHVALENGSDVHVNERQKIRHYRDRSTGE